MINAERTNSVVDIAENYIAYDNNIITCASWLDVVWHILEEKPEAEDDTNERSWKYEGVWESLLDINQLEQLLFVHHKWRKKLYIFSYFFKDQSQYVREKCHIHSANHSVYYCYLLCLTILCIIMNIQRLSIINIFILLLTILFLLRVV